MAFDHGSIARRPFLRTLALAPLGMASLPASGRLNVEAAVAAQTPGPTPDQALQRLQDGNQEFVLATQAAGGRGIERRLEVSQGQNPFAIILGCADSRVPPEIVFNTGLGDLFVCRVAGNIETPEIIGSIEYGVQVLGAPLIMVLGHSSCGALDAALAVVTQGAEFQGYLSGLVDQLTPAAASIAGQPGNPLDNAIRANVQMTVARLLRRDPDLASRARDGRARVVGGVYDLASGRVDLVA
ncbi:MAG TPA: carbonic anhydrase [Chloroflexota bacterium]